MLGGGGFTPRGMCRALGLSTACGGPGDDSLGANPFALFRGRNTFLKNGTKKNMRDPFVPSIMLGLRRAGTALVRQTRLATSQVDRPAVAYCTAHCLSCRHPFAMSVFLAPLSPRPPPHFFGRISPVLMRWGAPRAGRGRGGASATEHERRQARWHHQSSGRYPPPQDRAVVNRLGIGLCCTTPAQRVRP